MDPQFRQRDGVEQKGVGADGKPCRGELAGEQSRLQDVDSIDQLGRDEGDRPGGCPGADLDIEAAPLFGLEQLGIAQAARLPVPGQDDGPCRDRAGEAAPADLVDPGDVEVAT